MRRTCTPSPAVLAARRFLDLGHHLEHAARTAAILPVAAGTGTELMDAEEQREPHLGHFQAAEFDSPAACHSPPAGQPSPTGDAPPPGRA